MSLSKPVTLLAMTMAASAPLVTAQAGESINFSKAFEPDVIGPGSVSTLIFTINNPELAPARNMSFTDVLPAGVTIADFANSSSTCNGSLTAPDGGDTISFANGSLGAQSECQIHVDVTSNTPGSYLNVSGNLTVDEFVIGGAIAYLEVEAELPGFSKQFLPSQVLMGERANLVFTIDNALNTSAATGLSFTDQLPPGLVIASPANASTDCGSPVIGATLTAEPGGNLISYHYFGTNTFPVVAAGESCTVNVDVVAQAVGQLGNASGQLTKEDINVGLVHYGRANATLQAFANPVHLVKSFLDDPVVPGTGVTLEFTVLNRSRTQTASNISFSDDLDATLTGLVAIGLPKVDVCGAGSQVSGTGLVTMTGGSLGPAQSCTFSIDLLVPAGAVSGAYDNQASVVSAEGVGAPESVNPVTGYGARDVLHVAPAPSISKSFLDDPVAAGGTATVEFTITNTSNDSTATDISFSDEFDVIMPTAVSTPAPGSCGGSSNFIFTPLSIDSLATLYMTGGDLPPGGSCTFSIEMNVANTAPSGAFDNLTSAITATIGEEAVTGQPASDQLVVVGGPRLTKQFLDNPVTSPGTATLAFNVSNDNNGQADQDVYDDFTGVSFTDDLEAVLPGLTAIGLPKDDVCGAGSSLSGDSSLTLTGGSIPMGANCAFQVQVDVPAGTKPGSYTNTSSEVTAMARGLNVSGNAATADIQVAGLSFTKEFTDDPVLAGETVNLEFTIENITPNLDATNIFFTDDLDDILTATGLPMSDVCGAGSSLIEIGSSIILTGGNLVATTSCSFSVTLQVSGNADEGTYSNRTSNLSAIMGGESVVIEAARDILVVGTGEDSIATATVTVNKTFSDQNPAEVDIDLVCSSGDVVVLDGTAGNGDAADFVVSGFTSPAHCTATEPNGTPGYSSNADACFELAIAADTESTCTITNTQEPITVTVLKAYTEVHPVGDPQVDITLTCPTAIVDGGTNSNTTATSGDGVNRKAEFVVSDFPFGGEDCVATESIPAGYALAGAPGCDALTVTPGGSGPSCTITNRPQTAILTIDKIFSDGNPELAVDVSANCVDQGGGPGITYSPSASGHATHNSDFITTVKYFAGATNCTALEQDPVGYTLDQVQSSCIAGVAITDVEDATCTMLNDQDTITILAFKEYQGREGPAVDFSAFCADGDLTVIDGSASVGSPAEFELDDFPWNGTTCTVTEPEPPFGYAVTDSTCDDLDMAPGDDDTQCTITNTEALEIPTMGSWGITILVVLILGIGMTGFRRFGNGELK